MDKFLEKIELDVKNKILSSANGESIIKPFNKVFKEVRDDLRKDNYKKKKESEEPSIYEEIVKEFLRQNPEFIKDKKTLEVGAGTGFIVKSLQDKGVDIVGIDLKTSNNNYGFEKTYTNIIESDAISFIKKNTNYDTILMSWPNYNNNFAFNVLKNMRQKQILLYIGEGYGGCTANDNFFNLLKDRATLLENQTLEYQKNSISWPCIHDNVYVYEIKK